MQGEERRAGENSLVPNREQARNWDVNNRGLWVLWLFSLSLRSPFQLKNFERFFGQISFSERKVVKIPVLGLSGDAECLAG